MELTILFAVFTVLMLVGTPIAFCLGISSFATIVYLGLPPLVVAWGGLAVGAVVLVLAGAVGALPLAAPRVDVTLLDTRVSWLVPVLGLSLVAAVVAYVTGILGARLLGAKVASFVGLTEVLFAVLSAWWLVAQRPTLTQVAGGVLVVAAVALIRWAEPASG